MENKMELSAKKLRIELPYNPENLLQGIYPNKTKTLIWKDICTPRFIATLFTVAKIWRQHKCLPIDEWTKKMWYTHTMEYSQPLTRDKNLPFETIWMDLEAITLLKQNRWRKTNTVWFHVYVEFKILKNKKHTKQNWNALQIQRTNWWSLEGRGGWVGPNRWRGLTGINLHLYHK